MIGDDDPIKPPPRFTPLVLDRIGIDELGEYVGQLRDEVRRVEAEIARKEHHRAGAASLFTFKN